MLGGTDDTRGKCGLDVKIGGERFGLRVAAGRRGGVIVIVFEICRIPDPRRCCSSTGWLYFSLKGVRLSDG